jgi:hypothetical protein
LTELENPQLAAKWKIFVRELKQEWGAKEREMGMLLCCTLAPQIRELHAKKLSDAVTPDTSEAQIMVDFLSEVSSVNFIIVLGISDYIHERSSTTISYISTPSENMLYVCSLKSPSQLRFFQNVLNLMACSAI